MRKKIKKIIILAVGIAFIILGFLGLALPFLQGILFFCVGIILISFSFPKIRMWMNKRVEKYPHLIKIIDKTEKWINKIFGEK